MAEKMVLTIGETVQRSKAEGYPLTEYTLRRALRMGVIPCRRVGRRYLIFWPNIVRFLECADGQDIAPLLSTQAQGTIRRVTTG